MNKGLVPNTFVGDPPTTVHAETSENTDERAPTTAPSPIRTPGPMKTSAATHASASISMHAETTGIFGARKSWLAEQR
jgi:hypothetical protein